MTQIQPPPDSWLNRPASQSPASSLLIPFHLLRSPINEYSGMHTLPTAPAHCHYSNPVQPPKVQPPDSLPSTKISNQRIFRHAHTASCSCPLPLHLILWPIHLSTHMTTISTCLTPIITLATPPVYLCFTNQRYPGLRRTQRREVQVNRTTRVLVDHKQDL